LTLQLLAGRGKLHGLGTSAKSGKCIKKKSCRRSLLLHRNDADNTREEKAAWKPQRNVRQVQNVIDG
jgi:hypothetical protein